MRIIIIFSTFVYHCFLIVLVITLVLFALWQLVLELCRGDGVANLQTIQSHLDKIHACSAELSSDEDHMVRVLRKHRAHLISHYV